MKVCYLFTVPNDTSYMVIYSSEQFFFPLVFLSVQILLGPEMIVMSLGLVPQN